MPVTQDFAVIRKCWRQLLQSSPHWQASHCLNLLIRHTHRSDEQGDGIAAASRPQQLLERPVILSGCFACTVVQSVRRFVDCCLFDLLAQLDGGLKHNRGTGRMPVETYWFADCSYQPLDIFNLPLGRVWCRVGTVTASSPVVANDGELGR